MCVCVCVCVCIYIYIKFIEYQWLPSTVDCNYHNFMYIINLKKEEMLVWTLAQWILYYYSYHAFTYILYFNQQNALIKLQKYMYHKTHLILGTNSYMFWHQGAILRELNNNKGLYKSDTYFRH